MATDAGRKCGAAKRARFGASAPGAAQTRPAGRVARRLAPALGSFASRMSPLSLGLLGSLVACLALLAPAPAMAQAGGDGMIVIPGRGESAETALANASAASARGAVSHIAAGNPADSPAAVSPASLPSGISTGLPAVSLPSARPVRSAATPPATETAGYAAGYAAGLAAARRAAGTQPGLRPAVYRPAEANGANRANGWSTGAVGATAPSAGTLRAAFEPSKVAGATAQQVMPVVAGAADAAAAARPGATGLPAGFPPAAARTGAPAQPGANTPPAPPAGQQDNEAIRQAALAFLRQQTAGLPGKSSVTVAPSFPRGLAACTTLEPFLPTGARLWGRTTVGMRCAGERPWTLYLQAKISIEAPYYVAAHAIGPGELLSAADLVVREGDLTLLPLAVVTDPAQAVGATSLMRCPGYFQMSASWPSSNVRFYRV